MSIVPGKYYAEQSVSTTISAFYHTMGIGNAWKRANGSKQKGIPFPVIFLYLLQLVYTGKSMFEDLRSDRSLCVCSKDTVYRLLHTTTVNWTTFLLCIAAQVIRFLKGLSSEERKAAFVVDDTFYGRPYGKKVELCSKVYDHASNGCKFKSGFRLLTLGWTDGSTFVPVAFRHMSSQEQKNRLCEVRRLDRRTCGSKIRREALMPMPQVVLTLLKNAFHRGISASYILFDSWFFSPKLVMQLHMLGLATVARVKNTSKLYYLHEGEKKTAAQIFRGSRKRRGRSKYLLCVPITLSFQHDRKGPQQTLDARLVFVRDRCNKKRWIALLCTDPTLTEEEIISLYGRRWQIEVCFKMCKSFLRLTGEFRCLSYDAMTAHTTIVLIRYQILALEKRKTEDPRSLGALFFHCYDEVSDIRFAQALPLLLGLFDAALQSQKACLTSVQCAAVLDAFLALLPPHFRTCLCA